MGEYTKPVPDVTALMRPFWEAARQQRLLIQRCLNCGTHRFPAREICSRCLSREAEWVAASGKGRVFSYATMHQAYHPGFAADIPYAVVMVKLVEGPRIVSSLVDCPPGRIRIGTPVEVCFEQVTPDITLPKFRLVPGCGIAG